MRGIDYSGPDTVFLELNADSTFYMGNRDEPVTRDTIPGWHTGPLSGTWSVRDKKILELTLPPRQELYFLPFRIVHVSKAQLILAGPGSRPGEEPQTYTRIE
jgi:hypothetical protein